MDQKNTIDLMEGKMDDIVEWLLLAGTGVGLHHKAAEKITTLRAENERMRDAMVDMAMTLNKTAEYQVAELMAQNDRLRHTLEKVEQQIDYGQIDAAHQILIVAIDKEALK